MTLIRLTSHTSLFSQSVSSGNIIIIIIVVIIMIFIFSMKVGGDHAHRIRGKSGKKRKVKGFQRHRWFALP